ncbi:hypothetical protein RHSIM_Rhsim02G0160200 [Rhododendron simsii]|uniref:Uncharacterized protein n=1 Tax=Rhododendron simsii TaxID=118357 RepID=A0A834HFS4_RHOSS|nr:hypothetical protein RHSIM_Rhsim02G0160200 [Rhododendron simsii]
MWTEAEQPQLHFAQKKYKKLKETRGEEYARNNPPAGVNPEQWTSLITKKWTVPNGRSDSKKKKKNKQTNTTNRSDFLPFSDAAFAAAFLRSFLSLCLLLLILGGVVPAVTEIYKSTHFNKDMYVYQDKMVQIEAEHKHRKLIIMEFPGSYCYDFGLLLLWFCSAVTAVVYLHLWRFDVVVDANPETFSSDADMWFGVC